MPRAASVALKLMLCFAVPLGREQVHCHGPDLPSAAPPAQRPPGHRRWQTQARGRPAAEQQLCQEVQQEEAPEDPGGHALKVSVSRGGTDSPAPPTAQEDSLQLWCQKKKTLGPLKTKKKSHHNHTVMSERRQGSMSQFCV